MAGRYLLLHWKSTKAPSSTQRFNDTMSFLKSEKLLRYYGPLQSCKCRSLGTTAVLVFTGSNLQRPKEKAEACSDMFQMCCSGELRGY